MTKVMICGTRNRSKTKEYMELVFEKLKSLLPNKDGLTFIEGCCPDSADSYAEEYAKQEGIPVKHFPSQSGNYLKRNIEMVKEADKVIAFWNGFSYGTAHSIAHAAKQDKVHTIINIRKFG